MGDLMSGQHAPALHRISKQEAGGAMRQNLLSNLSNNGSGSSSEKESKPLEEAMDDQIGAEHGTSSNK